MLPLRRSILPYLIPSIINFSGNIVLNSSIASFTCEEFFNPPKESSDPA